MTTYKQTAPRAEFVRQRRPSKTPRKVREAASRQAPKRPAKEPSRRASPFASLFMPVEPRVDPRRRQARSSAGTRQPYEFTFTAANARVRSPGITLPQFNPHWISAALTAALLFTLYTLWTSSTFIVNGAEISGNQRLGATEINASMHLVGKPIFAAVPAQMESTLQADYPDLASVHVSVAFPNRIIIEVAERTPLLAWYQNDAMAWVDASGVAFPPRGAAEGLINLVANGTPPQAPDETLPAYEQAYVPPEMVQALTALYPYVPAGVPMVYDPEYGMGWQDPRGWQVFFGQTTDDIALKVQAYQAIVDALTREGRQPTLISIAYLEAPFYK
jgi:hypothetical protein